MKWYLLEEIELQGQPFIKKVKAGSKDICVVGYEGKLYAIGASCPHAGAELSGGWCKDGKIVCPFHRYSYDLATGKGSTGQNDYVDVYPVEIREGKIFVGITSLWDKITGKG